MDYTVDTPSLEVNFNNQGPVPVSFTLLEDQVALETAETFSLVLSPGTRPTTDFELMSNVIVINRLEITIEKSQGLKYTRALQIHTCLVIM